MLCGDDLELQIGGVLRLDEVQELVSLGVGDFVFCPSGDSWFHPGVTLAVGEAFGRVKSYLGFWIVRRQGKEWRSVDLHVGEHELQIPGHLSR